MTEHHAYVPTGNPRWRTCKVCGHGANTSIHRPPYGRGEVDDRIALAPSANRHPYVDSTDGWHVCSRCGYSRHSQWHLAAPYGHGEVDDRIALARRTSADLDASVRAYLLDDEPDANDHLERNQWDADRG